MGSPRSLLPALEQRTSADEPLAGSARKVGPRVSQGWSWSHAEPRRSRDCAERVRPTAPTGC
jgi:hypothetical protein